MLIRFKGGPCDGGEVTVTSSPGERPTRGDVFLGWKPPTKHRYYWLGEEAADGAFICEQRY